MNYKDFFHYLKKWRQFKKFPPTSGWPSEITLDGKAWDGIKKLYTLTRMDQHEYESSVFYLEGETFLTSPFRGTRDQVSSSHTLSVTYRVDKKKRLYYRNVIVDGKLIVSDPIKPDQLPKQTEIGFLFNIHSHPEHINVNGAQTYSFFSDTDIRTLIGTDVLVSGLVTDAFWLVAKTDRTISNIGQIGEELLREVSEKAFAGEQYLDETIKKNMARWGLVFYRADFNRPLRRIN